MNIKDLAFGFTWMQIGLIIVMVIFIWYSVETNALVPNKINQTNSTAPVKYIYTLEDEVPKNYLTQTHMILGFIILGGLVLSFTKSKTIMDEIDIEEARKVMDTYLKNRKTIETTTGEIIEIGEFKISPNFFERIITDPEKEDRTLKFVLQINITDLDGMPHYVKGYVHPKKQKVTGFMPLDKPLGEEDQCPDCGTEFDVAYVDTEDLRKARKIIKGEKD